MTREEWIPLTYIRAAVRCDFCWRTIPKHRDPRGLVVPGANAHALPRGGEIRAWWQPQRNVVECCGCHAELERVEAHLEGRAA